MVVMVVVVVVVEVRKERERCGSVVVDWIEEVREGRGGVLA